MNTDPDYLSPTKEIWDKMDSFDRDFFQRSQNGTLLESEKINVLYAAADHESCNNWDVGNILRNLKYGKRNKNG